MSGLNKQMIEDMTCGMFNNKSYWGIKSNILKSGVCKYYRRGMMDKFEWCVVEMMIFGFKNKGLMTNILNRLKILLFEEIVISEVNLILICIDIMNKIDEEEDIMKKIGLVLEYIAIVKKCRRGRLVSYVKNWWKYKGEEYDLDGYELNKVLKYRKKDDSIELLKWGELLIECIEEKDDRMIDIFEKMCLIEGKMGRRYRRRDGIYLYWEIIEDMMDSKLSKVFEFSKKMFYRKSMNERYYFGVWMGMFLLDASSIKIIEKEYVINIVSVVKYFGDRKKMNIDEDFVVKDFHVNKKYGLDKFGKVGCFVENEDLGDLGDLGEIYRDFYVEKKIEIGEEEKLKKNKVKYIQPESKSKNSNDKQINNLLKLFGNRIKDAKDNGDVVAVVGDLLKEFKKANNAKNKKVRKNKLFKLDLEKNLEFINWNKFEIVKVLEEGVCGLKKCCIIVKYKEVKYVIKEMNKGFNYGRDYEMMDGLKKLFGIKDLEMRRIRSNKGLFRVDINKRSLVGNWKFDDIDSVYCMMKFYENIGDLGKNKNVLNNKKKVKELLKIRLFDGLFRSSDNILRNVLVGVDGELISIDEGDMFGKRSLIFNKKGDWSKKNMDMDMLNVVIKEMFEDDVMKRKETIKKMLLKFGFDEKVTEFEERIMNYRKIVLSEFD